MRINAVNTGCLLSAESLSIGYREHIVAEKIAFSIKKGEILTLLGPNGCGKSTLLKTLCGSLPPLKGEIKYGDIPLSQFSSKEKAERIALVTTKREVKARLTVREIVLLGRYPYMDSLLRERSEDTEACEHAMELTGVAELAYKPADRLSDGQLQRVMLARALCQDTELILMDEPFSFLDLNFRIRILKLLEKAAKEEDKGLIIALHDLREAALISDRMLCFTKSGVRLLEDPYEELNEELIRDIYDIEGSEYEALWKLDKKDIFVISRVKTDTDF